MTAVFPLLVALALPAGLSPDDTLTLGDQVTYFGAEVPGQVEVGGELDVVLHLRVDETLPSDSHLFVHLESQTSDWRRCGLRPLQGPEAHSPPQIRG